MVRYVIYLFGVLGFKSSGFFPSVWFPLQFVSDLISFHSCPIMFGFVVFFWLILFEDVTKSINKSYVIFVFHLCCSLCGKNMHFTEETILHSLKMACVTYNVLFKQTVSL